MAMSGLVKVAIWEPAGKGRVARRERPRVGVVVVVVVVVGAGVPWMRRPGGGAGGEGLVMVGNEVVEEGCGCVLGIEVAG